MHRIHRNHRTLIAISGAISDRNIVEYAAGLAECILTHVYSLTPYLLAGNRIADSFVYAAKEHPSDLIVVNTPGRSNAASIPLGSVASQVLIESPVAILAVNHFGSMLNPFQVLRENQFWTKSGPKTN